MQCGWYISTKSRAGSFWCRRIFSTGEILYADHALPVRIKVLIQLRVNTKKKSENFHEAFDEKIYQLSKLKFYYGLKLEYKKKHLFSGNNMFLLCFFSFPFP